jgi:hypothetical protein
MSEALKIAVTVLGGVTVFVIGQLIVKFLIEPIHDHKKLVGEIAATIIFYSNVGAGMEQYYYDQIKAIDMSDDPQKQIVIDRYKDLLKSHWARCDEASITLRRQATELLGKTHAVPCYRFFSRIKQVPKLDHLTAACSELIGMSNSTHGEDRYGSRIETIIRLLNLRTVAKQRGMSIQGK